MGAGAKIIEGLREAAEGKFAVVTIDGVTWRPDGGWQDIESAPRDGTPVIIYVPVSWGQGYCIGEASFLADEGDDSGWWWAGERPSEATCDRVEIEQGDPTHWMPLPHPPRSP